MRRRVLVVSSTFACAWLVAACCPTPPVKEPAPIAQPPEPAPLPPVPGTETLDEGSFVLRLKDQVAGKEVFAIRKGETITLEHEAQVTASGVEITSHGVVTVGDDWKPKKAEVKGKVSGVEFAVVVDGTPLTATSTVGGKEEKMAATHAVDLFIAQNVISHFAPVCQLPAEATTRWVFPGTELKVEAPVAVPEGAPVEGVVRRAIALGGAMAADVYCQGGKLIAFDAPSPGAVAVREGSQELFEKARRRERTKPALPDGLVELERKVQVPAGKDIEAATLACSLLVPSAYAEVKTRATTGPTKALPAVVFVTGSGKQDRDEDTYGPGGLKLSIFKVMAIELGKAGIASLRCDDRGSGASTGDFTKATLQAFAADTTAALAALRDEPAIDPKHTGLVGHSDGGAVAPMVAVPDRYVKAVVLMAAIGRTLDVVSLEQVERQARAAGLPADKVEAQVASSRAVFTAIRKGEPLPADVPASMRAELEASRAWLRSEIEHDPLVTARLLRRPAVFIAQGDKDQQVAVADAEALKAALAKAGNKKVEYKVYPNLNHLFAPSTTGDIAEYSDPNAAVDAGFLADVVAFLSKRL